MTEPKRIQYRAIAEIPNGSELLQHMGPGHPLVLKFPIREEDRKLELISDLKKELPENYRVFDSGRDGQDTWVTIKQIISRPELERIEQTLVESARHFRHTARGLAQTLAYHNGIMPTEIWENFESIEPFPGEWDLFFHGEHCRFTHESTGQVVEVSFWFKDEFGILDPTFFHTYLQTTPELGCPKELRDPFHDTARALEYLLEQGHLKTATGKFNRKGCYAPKPGLLPLDRSIGE